MIIKEKRWLSRFVAMLCVLTMVVGVLTPASVGVADETAVAYIILTEVEGITYYDDLGDPIAETLEYESSGYETDSYKYEKFDNNIKVTALGGNFSSTFRFSIYADAEPDISVNNGANRTISLLSSNKWQVTLRLGNASGNITVTPSKQYTITFPEGEGYEVSSITGAKVNDLSATAKTGTVINFDVTLKDSVSESKELSVVAYGDILGATEINGKKYSYSVEVGTRNTTVAISVVDKTFTINDSDYYNIDNEGFTYIRNTDNNQVNYGKNFSFSVYPAEGYTDPEVTMGDDSHGSLKQNGTVYNIINITGNQKINIKSGEQEKYEVHFSTGIGYTVIGNGSTEIDENGVVRNVDYGGAVKFEIVLDNSDAYKIVSVTSGGKTVPFENNIYTLSNIKDNTTVNIVVQKQMFDVKFVHKNSNDNGKKYTVSGTEGKFEYGTNYSFYVNPIDSYGTPTVTVNGEPINPINGTTQYIITITKDTTITITAGEQYSPTISFNSSPYYSFTDEKDGEAKTSVTYGENYKFKVKLDDNYNKSDITVTANGVNITPDREGVYTIEQVKIDQFISVSGITKNAYTVTLTKGKEYTITAYNDRVTAGESFNFNVSINEGYEPEDEERGIKVSYSVGGSNKTELPAENEYGDYTIERITGDTTIEVSGIQSINPKITVEASNATVQKAAGGAIEQTVNYDSSLEFKAVANEYYQVTQVAVNGQKIEAIDGIYTINGIKDDVRIKVITRANVLTVNYRDEKYNKSKTVRYSVDYTGNGDDNVEKATGTVKLMESLATSELYKPDGWLDDTGDEKSSLTIDKEKDTEVTLTAKWVLDIDKIKENITLTTDAMWGGPEGGYSYTIKFTTNFGGSPLNEEYIKDIKVTGVGTLYAGHPIDSGDDAVSKYKETILKRSGEASEELFKQALDDKVFSYYKDYTDKDATMLRDGTYISLRLGSESNKVKRYGVGWVELTINNEKVILFSKDCKELTPFNS